MKDIFTPLIAKEMNQIDDFLLNRVNDDVDIANKDEGIVCLSGLDGYFAAIVSAPVMSLPSQWVPGLWGDFEPERKGNIELEVIFLLCLRHMNAIANVLLEKPHNYEPIFIEHEVDGEVFSIVDEWCEGYMRGLLLDSKSWHLEKTEIKVLLDSIKNYIGDESLSMHTSFSHEEAGIIKNNISSTVREIYAYWLARKEKSLNSIK